MQCPAAPSDTPTHSTPPHTKRHMLIWSARGRGGAICPRFSISYGFVYRFSITCQVGMKGQKLSSDQIDPATGYKTPHCALQFPTAVVAKTLPSALCFHCLRGQDTAFCLVFSLPYWSRHCLLLCVSTAFVAKTPPFALLPSALCFHCLRGQDTAFCFVFPLPSWQSHRLLPCRSSGCQPTGSA